MIILGARRALYTGACAATCAVAVVCAGATGATEGAAGVIDGNRDAGDGIDDMLGIRDGSPIELAIVFTSVLKRSITSIA